MNFSTVKSKGFTLVEIIIALTIVGVVLGVASVQFGTYKNNIQAKENARTFFSFLNLAGQQGRVVMCPKPDMVVKSTTGAKFWDGIDLRLELKNGKSIIKTEHLVSVKLGGDIPKDYADVGGVTLNEEQLGVHLDFINETEGKNELIARLAYIGNKLPVNLVNSVVIQLHKGATTPYQFTMDNFSGSVRVEPTL